MASMAQRKTWILVGLALLLLAGSAALLIPRAEGTFTGSRVKNPDAYLLDIEWMNGTDRHELSLDAGDVLGIHFETAKGSLRLSIAAPDGTEIYRGNGTEATDFAVTVPQKGVYSIAVEARQARGVLRIQKQASSPQEH